MSASVWWVLIFGSHEMCFCEYLCDVMDKNVNDEIFSLFKCYLSNLLAGVLYLFIFLLNLDLIKRN